MFLFSACFQYTDRTKTKSAELAVSASNGAGASSPASGTYLEVDNPVPAITSTSPSAGVAGASSTIVTLGGDAPSTE